MSLPNNYTRLEYLASSDAQYIDTGFKPNQNTRVIIDCWRTATTTTYPFPFGSRTGLTHGFDAAIGETQVFYHYGANYQFVNFADAGERMIIDANKATATFTSASNSVSITLATSTFQETENMVLFSLNEAGSVYTGDSAFTGNIYSCRIYDNGILIRNYIPCKNPSGILGMWDDVNETFCQNSGSGSFTGGAEFMGNLPIGYKQIEYITSSGTQYIDSGLKPDNNTKVEMRAQSAQTANAAFFGGATTYPQNAFECFTTGAVFGSGTYWNHVLYSDDFIDIVMSADGLYKDNTKLTSFGAATFTSPSNLALCTRNRNDGTGEYLIGKIASCKIYQNGVLTRNFIPCINPQQVVGMYDTVNAQFYNNSGTGVFEAGPEINTSAIYVKVNGEWKQVDGVTVNVN